MQEFGFSEEHSFITPPVTGPDAAVKFLAIADLGQAEEDGSLAPTEMLASLNTTRRLAMETGHHQLLIHNGDISYARGFQSIWDACAALLNGYRTLDPQCHPSTRHGSCTCMSWKAQLLEDRFY